MPTSGVDDEDVKVEYAEIKELLKLTKGNDNVFIMGDWNAVAGEKKTVEKWETMDKVKETQEEPD